MAQRHDWQLFKKLLEQHGINKLYHFTDRANLESIVRAGGLYSWADCGERGISIPKPGGDDLSHGLDRHAGLHHYVRLSFTPRHPMMYSVKANGRISNPVVLEIDVSVIFEDTVVFSDCNATRKGARVGGTFDAFKAIHFNSVKSHNHFDLPEEEQPYFQAEILVEKFLPLDKILNIGDFGVSMPPYPVEAPVIEVRASPANTESWPDDGIEYSPDGKTLLKAPRDIVNAILPPTLQSIGESTFCGCKSLQNIILPSTLQSIGESTFCGCKSLQHIILPPTLQSIGKSAFCVCESLQNITLPPTLQSIGEGAFANCNSLVTIFIPHGFFDKFAEMLPDFTDKFVEY